MGKFLTVFFIFFVTMYSFEINSYIRSWPLGSSGKETVKGNYFDGNKIKNLDELTIAFAKLEDNGAIHLVDIEPDKNGYFGFETFRDEVQKIKRKNPNTKVTLAIGGWGAEGFSELGFNNKKLGNFLESIKNKVKLYGFDGLEINWLYPVNGGNGTIKSRPEDRETFSKLIKDIRKTLDDLSLITKKTYLLSFGVPANKDYVNWISIKDLVPHIDYVTLQAYDYDYSFKGKTSHISNLYSSTSNISTSSFVDYFVASGFPKEKIIIGVPLYGKAWKVYGNDKIGLNVTYAKNLYPQGVAYDLIKKLIDFGFKEKFDDSTKSAYIFENNTFISYENEKSIKEKIDYAKKTGLRGIKFWEYGNNYNGELIDFSIKYNKMAKK